MKLDRLELTLSPHFGSNLVVRDMMCWATTAGLMPKSKAEELFLLLFVLLSIIANLICASPLVNRAHPGHS